MTKQRTVAKRFGDRERQRLEKFFRLLGTDNKNEFAAARGQIDSLLHEFGKSWFDLIQLLNGGTRTTIRADLAGAIGALGSNDPDVGTEARRHLAELLARHRKSWNDLVDELCSVSPGSWVSGSSAPDPDRDPDLLALICFMLREYVELREHEYVAVALWTLHSHVYRHFMVTPRLVLRSPTPGCGKTVLLDVLTRLTARAKKFDSVTAAAIYRLVDATHPTLLVDEADNLGLMLQPSAKLRAVFNAGHHHPGDITIQDRGEPRTFSTFCPLALALPDTMLGLPRTLNDRSITVLMQRADGLRELRRIDINHPDPAFDAVYGQILLWSRDVKLDPDPAMPAEVRNRAADNWRPLISIADSLRWGQRAREAMMVFMREFTDADVKIVLLGDIRKVFDMRRADRLPSADLLSALCELDADWSEFGGVRGDQQPHKLKSTELAGMLRAFGIRPRPIWPSPRTAKSKSARGYLRSQFAEVWQAYCDGVTASQSSNVKTLRPVGGGTV